MLKKLLSLFSALAMCALLVPFSAFAEEGKSYETDNTFDVAGVDQKVVAGVYVFPNRTDSPRVIPADEYNFSSSYILIFDGEGRLIECGSNLYVDTRSPQLSATVPPKGFLVALSYGSPKAALKCYTVAMEGAMLYNATMSVTYPVFGSFDESAKKLRIAYDEPKEPSEDAVRFLFVGNSSTYFNGTPIKFKALCKAAGMEVVTDYCTFGAAYLHEFADENHDRGKKLREMLSKNKYDFVVLQDAGASDYSVADPAMDIILPLVEANGATPLLYMRYASDTDPKTGINTAKRHHNTYTRISLERGILCCPSAHSFLICADKYPEINLFADDNAHHSKEGSYLIACTWLKTFMGIDPIGNTYTAELDAETVSKLQECALSASNLEYVFPGDNHTRVIDGKEYTNYAFGKLYTPSGKPYEGEWTDTGSNGKPLGRLTDGIVAQSGTDPAIGAYKGELTSVVIDLGSSERLKLFSADLYGNPDWGIPDPHGATVSFSVSENGTDFSDILQEAEREYSEEEGWQKCVFTLICPETVEARYVKVTYQLSGGEFCWSSEISVFGEKPEPPSQESQASVPQEESGKKLSVTAIVCIVISAIAVLAAVFAVLRRFLRK